MNKLLLVLCFLCFSFFIQTSFAKHKTLKDAKVDKCIKINDRLGLDHEDSVAYCRPKIAKNGKSSLTTEASLNRNYPNCVKFHNEEMLIKEAVSTCSLPLTLNAFAQQQIVYRHCFKLHFELGILKSKVPSLCSLPTVLSAVQDKSYKSCINIHMNHGSSVYNATISCSTPAILKASVHKKFDECLSHRTSKESIEDRSILCSKELGELPVVQAAPAQASPPPTGADVVR